MTARVRNTTATQQRADNMRRLIANLALGEMRRDEIATFLGYGPSGVRQYVKDLITSGVIQIDRHDEPSRLSIGMPVYVLTGNTLCIESFLSLLDQPASKRGGCKTLMVKALGDPTRHLHLLNDDAPFTPRMRRDKPVVHTDLMAAFYPQLARGES